MNIKNIKKPKKGYKKFADSAAYKFLKTKIKDELEDTESTSEAIQVALDNLEVAEEPEQAVAAVVEVLSDVLETIEETANIAEEGLNEEFPEEELEDVEVPEDLEEATDSLNSAKKLIAAIYKKHHIK